MMPRIITLEDYRTLARPRLSWLVFRLIPKPGAVLLVGAAKAGKTTLALQIASAITTGADFLGQRSAQGRVLYLQIDPGETVWRDRLDELASTGLDLSRVQAIHPDDRPWPLNILSPDGRAWLQEVLKAANPDLVIVDVLRELHSADENDSTAMKAVGDALTKTFLGRGLLLLHHTAKIEVDPIHSTRGSSYVAGKVDLIWVIRRNKLYIVSRLDEDRVIEGARGDAGIWEFPALEIAAEVAAQVLALCEERRDLSHAQLARTAQDRLGLSRSKYYRALAGRSCAHGLRETSHTQ